MSVSSLYSGVNASDTLSPLYAPTAAATGTPSASTADGSSASGSASTSVSSTAKLLKQLQDLSQTNPDEFKKVTADIAAQLQAQAQQTGGTQGQFLSSLASKFQQASQTGDASALAPKHHRHHHGSGGSASASAASQASAAYQQSGAQSAGSQIDAIISQVLTKDTGAAKTGAA